MTRDARPMIMTPDGWRPLYPRILSEPPIGKWWAFCHAGRSGGAT